MGHKSLFIHQGYLIKQTTTFKVSMEIMKGGLRTEKSGIPLGRNEAKIDPQSQLVVRSGIVAMMGPGTCKNLIIHTCKVVFCCELGLGIE